MAIDGFSIITFTLKPFGTTSMDRFLAMKVFARVVEAGSFSKAADALRLPPASVSRTLQALEAHLGARLINRTTRSISITEDGEAYYDRCVRVLGEVDDMEASLSHSKLSPKGHVKVSLPQVMAKSTIIPALPDFFAKYPEIGIELVLTDRQVDLVEEAIDCVVRVGAVGDVGLVAKRIGAYSQITCASPGYIEQYGEPMTLDELDAHQAIGYVLNKSGRVRNWEFDVDGEARVFAMKHKIAVNDGDSYIAAGVAGLGLIQSSSYTLDPLLKSGKLVQVLKDYPSHARVVSVLYAANRHQPRRVRVFIDWVAEFYSRLPIFQEKPAVVVVSG
jgi:LysR family transcriptional regulator, regulator for bpeEF and oprC